MKQHTSNWQLDYTSVNGISLWENDERSEGTLIATIWDEKFAEQIKDAGQVLNQSGLSPSELLEINQELKRQFEQLGDTADRLNQQKKDLEDEVLNRKIDQVKLQKILTESIHAEAAAIERVKNLEDCLKELLENYEGPGVANNTWAINRIKEVLNY